jgi:hypothetical protein
MIRSKIDSKKFMKEMNNIMNYSIGFLDGVKMGKQEFLANLGKNTSQILQQFIDANARVNPEALHHVYEWSRTGSPDARLFDINYTVSGLGLSLKSNFRQSTSVKMGSNVPFYNKASIMENGIGVTISPTRSNVLAFEDDGELIFTKNPVSVSNPGGDNVEGSFQRTFDDFFRNYFTQAFMSSSGIGRYLSNPAAFKKDMRRGSKMGRSKGISTGYRWIVNAGLEA